MKLPTAATDEGLLPPHELDQEAIVVLYRLKQAQEYCSVDKNQESRVQRSVAQTDADIKYNSDDSVDPRFKEW
jgi:hypothetical protein